MSYSRLPVPTSARSSVGSASTNFPGTVRKATLFTPQNKKISFPTGASTQSYKRTSMAPDRKYSKDPRPITDRDYQQECFERLVDFLSTHQYPHQMPDAKRFFQTVSTTETVRIFEFLLNFFYLPESPFKITHIEIDVPRALKRIDYPFTVTKSNLVSVTSKQSIATLLSIFDWLVNVINYMVAQDEIGLSHPDLSEELDGSNLNIKAELFKIISIAENDYEVEKRMIELADKEYGSEKEVLEKEMELEGANQEIKRMQDHLRSLQERDMMIERYTEQIKQDQLEIEQLKFEQDEQESDIKNQEQEIEEALTELAQLEEEVRQNEVGFNQEDYEMAVAKRDELLKKLDCLENENKKYQSLLKDMSIQYAKSNDKCKENALEIVSGYKQFKELAATLPELNSKLAPLIQEKGILVEQLHREATTSTPRWDTSLLWKIKTLDSQMDKIIDDDRNLIDDANDKNRRRNLDLEDNLSSMQKKIMSLQKEAEEEQASLEKLESDGQNTISRLEEELKELASVRRDLDKELVEKTREYQMDLESREKEVEQYQREVEEFCTEKDQDDSAWLQEKLKIVQNDAGNFKNLCSFIKTCTESLERADIESKEAAKVLRR